MKRIAVLVKRVPDTETFLKIGEDGKSVVTEGVNYVLNPHDEVAIEQALQFKEQGKVEEVVLVTVGKEQDAKELRQGLAMVADRGIVLTSAGELFDPAVVGGMLASFLSQEGVDLVLCGKEAIDEEWGQVGYQVAACLGIPFMNEVVGIKWEGSILAVQQEGDEGIEMFQGDLPVVLGVGKGLCVPRLPSMRGIMSARKKPMGFVSILPKESRIEILQVRSAPTRPQGEILGTGAEAVPLLCEKLGWKGEA